MRRGVEYDARAAVRVLTDAVNALSQQVAWLRSRLSELEPEAVNTDREFPRLPAVPFPALAGSEEAARLHPVRRADPKPDPTPVVEPDPVEPAPEPAPVTPRER